MEKKVTDPDKSEKISPETDKVYLYTPEGPKPPPTFDEAFPDHKVVIGDGSISVE